MQKQYNDSSKGIAPRRINSFTDYIGALYAFTIESLNTVPLAPEDWSRCVTINSSDIGPRVRALKPVEISTLYINGYAAITAYLKD